MYRQLIINDSEHETRVALLEDGNLAELFIERGDLNDIAGNIYKGKVQRVLPGMQAAFVDIGLGQAAFLYAGDVIGNQLSAADDAFADRPLDREASFAFDIRETNGLYTNKGGCIEDLLTEGHEILVYVSKSPMGTKGARVTTYISIPGRLLVMMPNSEHIGVSRKIEDSTERLRLKEMVHSLRTESYGYIVRTAAEGVGREKMIYEMGFLHSLWKDIQSKLKTYPAPSLLHKELNISLRAVRDLLTHEAQKLIIDSRRVYDSVMSFLDSCMPGLKSSVELYDDSEPIFDAFNLEGDISRALMRKIWLKSGGYIIIEQTEALVAIDVNTGRYVGKHNLDETVLKTNLEAVKEIAYQIRLRDIGGIIIIDFIDMEKKSGQEKVFNALKDALKRDRSKTHILHMSELGLIQMTRKRIRKPLTSILCEPCFYCEGEGYLVSRQSICLNIYREIKRESHDMSGTKVTLRVNPRIAEFLHDEQSGVVESLESNIGMQIVIYPNPKFHLEEFDIFENAS